MRNVKKFLAAFCALVLTLTTVLYAWDRVGSTSTAAENDSSSITIYDFRDGSVIPTDTPGNVDVTKGDLTVKVGSKNAYQYNGAQHGVAFKDGNSIEIKVGGATKVTVGDCQFNNATDLIVRSADGKYSETKTIKSGCYNDNGSNTVVFNYKEKTATTLIIDFTNTTYVPIIITEPIKDEPEPEPDPDTPDVKTTYDFRDGSVIPTSTPGNVDVTKGKLTVKVGSKNAYQYNGAQHGVAFKDGNSIEIKVGGATKVTIGDCQFNNATELTVRSADGKYSETKTIKSGCYNDNGSGSVVFNYKEKTATTLIIDFTNTTYVPIIITEPIKDEPEPEPDPDTPDVKTTYDFRDGSVIPTSTPGNVDVTKGKLTVKVGSKNAYQYNGAQHGVMFKDGNSIEIKVGGATKVTVGDCQFNNATELTVRSADGKYSETKTIKTGCYNNNGSGTVVFNYKGKTATTLIVDFTNTTYVPIIITEPIEDEPEPDPEDPTVPPEPVGNGKADVWDFGAEQLSTSKYNNKLTASIINKLYPSGTAAGSKNVNIGSFTTPDGELRFEANGGTSHRIRTTNTSITRYDDKNMTVGSTVLNGYLYSNSGSTSAVYLAVKLYDGDILTVYAGGNNGDSTVVCESPSGGKQSQKASKDGQMLTFYASETGEYKIYSADEKLVVGRMIREHTNPVKVSGTVDISAASGISDYKICFTNKLTGKETKVSVKDGAYTAYLYDSYTYELSLVDANGYVIKNNAALAISKGSKDVTRNIVIQGVDLVTVTGKLTGLSQDALKELKLSLVNTKQIYVPEITVTGDSFTAKLEKGVSYNITVENINDYKLSGSGTVKASADGTQNIAFALKPVYDVNITLNGITEEAKSSAVLTFANINEDGYTYEFAAGETPKLRDGTYTIKVKGIGSNACVQKLTSNLTVKGAAVSKTIEFEPIEVWDFAKYNENPGIETIGGSKYYLGLKLTGSVAENKMYLLLNNGGEIAIPVKAGQSVTLEYCYQAAFTVNGKQVSSNSGNTSKFETTQVSADADGFITVKGTGTTYFTKITIVMAIEFKERVTVGTNKEYKTVNDALDAVSRMVRPNNERVEIVIDPGNYEEMLVINIPNVSLINAVGENASLDITNKGVGIGNNVVRITSYYGHGYNYYSMGSDCKWNAETLAANKANGYISKENPGAGTIDGSYWNATVVINGDGFEADGIVFENSFNQYISKKEAADTVVMWNSGSKGARPTKYGDTSVQDRKFVERAAAMAILGDKSVFNNCKFVGRQDTLYGQTDVKAVFQKCDILGAVDFIFGGINAVFYQCNLRMNTSDDAKDLSYITAAQQSKGRGYMMYNCTVTSTTPGVDTASKYRSKPGYFGRPWQADTSEVIFYYTIVETTDYPGAAGKSLIVPEGWLNTLGGTSAKMCEYGTLEQSCEDNSASRAAWATILDTPSIDGGATEINIKAFLGDTWTAELNERGLVESLDLAEIMKPTEFENNDIEIIAPVGTFDDPDDIIFNAKLESTTNGRFTYDLSFTSKTSLGKVQPKAFVIVRIPLPETLKASSNIYVYHIETNGTYTNINCKVENDMVVFSANKFSNFIVSGSMLSSPSTPSNPGRPSGGSTRPSHGGSTSSTTSDPTTSSEPVTSSNPTTSSDPVTSSDPTTSSDPVTSSNPTTSSDPVTSSDTSTSSDSSTSSTSDETSSVISTTSDPNTTSESSGSMDPNNDNPSTGVGLGMFLVMASIASSVVIVTKKKR